MSFGQVVNWKLLCLLKDKNKNGTILFLPRLMVLLYFSYTVDCTSLKHPNRVSSEYSAQILGDTFVNFNLNQAFYKYCFHPLLQNP